MAELVSTQVGNYSHPINDVKYKYKCSYADGGNIYTNPMTNTAPAQPENVANVGNIGLPDDFSLMA